MEEEKVTRLKHFATRRLPTLGLGRTAEAGPTLLLLFAAYGFVAGTVYLQSGLGDWSPAFCPVGKSLALCIGFFFLPSLIEELVWRWTLIPPATLDKPTTHTAVYVLVSSIIFMAAHPIAALLFVPHARETFLHPAFLAIVFILGLTCGTSYVLSRSIWPPVVIHWLTVLVWKFLLGGPFVLLGR